MKWSKIYALPIIILPLMFGKLWGQSFPKWAEDQLYLRSIVEESIRETQKWQYPDGRLYYYLNTYKWDDEVEIFYFWLNYYYLTGDESVYESVRGIAQTYLQRAEEYTDFYHGYYSDAFFDTEHTLEGLIVLANLAWAKPDDQEVVDALVDVVEHAANLADDPTCRDWYEPSTRLLRSVRMGTQKVEENKNSAIDWVFNLQFVKMALAAYHANGDVRLLNWSRDYLDGWIDVMKRNEKENGYFLPPSEVDPYTGQIGPYSGVWWQSAFEPGWGWPEKGNNANRDMRGAFLDFYRMTGERRFLDAMRKEVQTLFDLGSGSQPAHYYDGSQWIVEDDKITVAMATEVSLLDEQIDPGFDDFMWRWYHFLRYPYPEQHFWAFQKDGNLERIDAINARSIDNAEKRLNDIKALTELPPEPDLFPQIGGYWGITLVPFGGVSSHRGEMPWQEIVYFKADQSLGLPDGMAALFESKTDSSKSLYLCNTETTDQNVWLQSGYLNEPIKCLYVDGRINRHVQDGRAKVAVPAQQTVYVQVINRSSDENAPLPVQMVTLYGK